MVNKKNRFLELDAFRGLAAIMVMFFHYTMNTTSWYSEVFRIGSTGVDLFFIISGFVIFLTVNNSKSWHEFLINRFCRLYPAYWVCVSITALLSIYFYYQTKVSLMLLLERYIVNMTMFQTPLGYPHLDGPYWTLYIEIQFYFLITLLLGTRSLNKIKFICGCTILFLVIYSVSLKLGFFQVEHLIALDIFPICIYLPLFISGICFYHLKNNKNDILWHLFIILCLLLQINFFNYGERAAGYIDLHQYIWTEVFYFSIFYLFVYEKMYFTINKVTLFIGKISYPLYLIHQFLGIKLLIPFMSNRLGFYYEISFLITVAFSICIAYLISTYVEVPVGTYLKKVFL